MIDMVPVLRKPSWLVLCASLLICCAPASAEEHFKNADEAVNALVSAVKSGDKSAILGVLGPDGRDIVSSGDEVADRATRENFVSAYDAKHTITQTRNSKSYTRYRRQQLAFSHSDRQQGRDVAVRHQIGPR